VLDMLREVCGVGQAEPESALAKQYDAQKRNYMSSLPSETNKPEIGPSAIWLPELLCAAGGVSTAEPESARGDVCGYRNEPE
jgi:hypothetical protein